MAQRKSTLTCRTCGSDLPRDAFDPRYKPDGSLRGKKLDCRRCLEQSAATVRTRIESAYIPNPSGVCQCGCGTPVERAWRNRLTRGWIKGEYIRFAPGHYSTFSALSPVEYLEEDRGHSTPCWIWQRGTDGRGYGMKYVKDHGMEKAYRVYYREIIGEIPDGYELHHECETTACVNPHHLRPLIRLDHMVLDGRSGGTRRRRSNP